MCISRCIGRLKDMVGYKSKDTIVNMIDIVACTDEIGRGKLINLVVES